MDGQGCDYDRIINGGSHRYSFYSYYCLYGKSILQLRFISWGIHVFLCPSIHADGQQGKSKIRFFSVSDDSGACLFIYRQLVSFAVFSFGGLTMRSGTMEAGLLSQRKEVNLHMVNG